MTLANLDDSRRVARAILLDLGVVVLAELRNARDVLLALLVDAPAVPFETAARCFLTRSVETSLLNCHLFQLCGTMRPSARSNSSCSSSSTASRSTTACGFRRRWNEISVTGGRVPPFCEAKQRQFTQNLNSESLSVWTLGS